MKSAIRWGFIAGLGLFSAVAAQNASAKWGPMGPPPKGNPLLGCVWQVNTEDRTATASCPQGSFVISGGCDTDQGSFRTGFPTGVGDGSPVTAGTGWVCRTTANQPITAAALCCPIGG